MKHSNNPISRKVYGFQAVLVGSNRDFDAFFPQQYQPLQLTKGINYQEAQSTTLPSSIKITLKQICQISEAMS